ncbi:transposon-transfer assisting family protein [Lachnospiraceae bacterium 62-26]
MIAKFEENEYFLVAMFQKESRQATIEEIHNVIPYIGRDEEMLALINSTLEKLWFLSDEAFLSMDLEQYRQEPLEDE